MRWNRDDEMLLLVLLLNKSLILIWFLLSIELDLLLVNLLALLCFGGMIFAMLVMLLLCLKLGLF